MCVCGESTDWLTDKQTDRRMDGWTLQRGACRYLASPFGVLLVHVVAFWGKGRVSA